MPGMRAVFAVVLFAFTASAQYQYTVPVTGLNITFSWTIDNNAKQLHAQLQLDGVLSWVGFAISGKENSDGNYGMAYADFNVAQFSPVCNISDYFLNNAKQGTPTNDLNLKSPQGVNNILTPSCSRTGTKSIAQWSRALSTGDMWDYDVITAGNVHVLFAHGTSDSFSYHKDSRTMGVLNFQTGQFSVTPGL